MKVLDIIDIFFAAVFACTFQNVVKNYLAYNFFHLEGEISPSPSSGSDIALLSAVMHPYLRSNKNLSLSSIVCNYTSHAIMICGSIDETFTSMIF